MKTPLILIITCISVKLCLAQTYDKKYVKNLKFRLLASMIGEVREINSYFLLNKSLDPKGKESLLLANSPSAISGFMFQANNSSFLLTSSVAQTENDIEKFGKQKSTILKFSYLNGGLYSNLNYIEQKGFYDKNYLNHPEFANDTLLFRRHQSVGLKWIGYDVSFYPGSNKFCLGMASFFGERQLKSRFAWGTRLAYNFVRFKNDNKAFFRDSIISVFPELSTSNYTYNGISMAVTPSLYLVSKKFLFCYLDGSFGFGLGRSASKLSFQFEIPQAKVVTGIHFDRFLFAVYYTYLNQSFKTKNVTIGNLLNNYGVILGFRINQYKYRNLKWDTI